MPQTATKFPILLKLATGRDDKGITNNYHVYEGGGVIGMKNARGEVVNKNVVLGGNGTIYVANDVAGANTEMVLMPKAMFDQLVKGGAAKAKK